MFRSLLVLSSVLRGWCPLSSSTGLVPSLQFFGVGALSPVLRGWCPPVLGLAPSSSRVGALQFSGWSPGSRSICLPVRSESESSQIERPLFRIRVLAFPKRKRKLRPHRGSSVRERTARSRLRRTPRGGEAIRASRHARRVETRCVPCRCLRTRLRCRREAAAQANTKL